MALEIGKRSTRQRVHIASYRCCHIVQGIAPLGIEEHSANLVQVKSVKRHTEYDPIPS